MMREAVEQDVAEVVRGFLKNAPETIKPDTHLRDGLGMVSLDLVLLREAIERRFAITIADDEVEGLITVGLIADLVTAKRGMSNQTAAETAPQPAVVASGQTSPHLTGGSHLVRDLLYSDLEVGMPMTGRNNLAETPLLREVGHMRWQHMSALSGVASKDVIDDDGERLYPTFFYLELSFPPAKPMATFGENDRFTVVSALRRYGRSMLDGEHYLFPAHYSDEQKRIPTSPEQGLQEGIPFLRLSNSFVKQWKGAGWLKKSRPADKGFERIPESAEPPATYTEATGVKESGAFFELPEHYVPLTEGPLDVDYSIVPDRDLNGAGLLYFANYPMILEIAEREVLARALLEDDLIDRRTLVSRKAAYFSNATSDEVLKVTIEPWIHNPFLSGEDPDIAPIRLQLNYRMHRGSDDRLMFVSSAKKVVLGRTVADTSLAKMLQAHQGD